MLFTSYGFTGDNHSADICPTSLTSPNQYTLTNCIADFFAMSRNVENYSSEEFNENWDYNTVFIAEFLENLLAGNLTYAISDIEALKIKRRKHGEFEWTTLKVIQVTDESSLSFVYNDILNQSNTEYDYALVPIISGHIEGDFNSITLFSQFNKVYILDETAIHSADLNASLSTTKHVAKSVVTTLGRKHPFVNKLGASNYTTGQMQATFIEMTPECILDIEHGTAYRELVSDFLSNDNPKIVKYDDGRIYLVSITGDISEDNSCWEAPVWSFEFTTIGDADNSTDLYNSGFIDEV